MNRDSRRTRSLYAPLALALLLASLLAIAVSAGAAESCTGPCLPGDKDGDTIKDYADNCPLNGNRRQNDNDSDSPAPVLDLGTPADPVGPLTGPVMIRQQTPIQGGAQDLPTDPVETVGGDECDLDDDNDGIYDKRKAGKPGPDNCRKDKNPDQADDDKDGVGNACDPNNGGAAVAKPVDNTPLKVTVGKVGKLRYAELGLGMPVLVRCSKACKLVAELSLDRKSAKRVKMPAGAKRVVFGRGAAILDAKGTTYVIVRIPKKTVANLQRRLKKVRPVLTVSTAGDGGKKISERRLLIRR